MIASDPSLMSICCSVIGNFRQQNHIILLFRIDDGKCSRSGTEVKANLFAVRTVKITETMLNDLDALT